jgi:phospholipid/cholesterol/gamma-HCH transport system ATP-binding protein
MPVEHNDIILRIEHLYKSFGDNHVLIDFNLNISRGESVVVLGKSGSGKSVLIKCLIGLIKPDSGSVQMLGNDVLAIDQDALDQMRAKVGFLFQSSALYDSMTVRENLQFPLRRHWMKESEKEEEKKVLEALSDVGLEHTIDMYPADLSGGMRKRIALARTLILKPELILFDEPTTGLDPITGREITQLMIEIQRKYNTTSLIISHDLNCVRMAATRVVMLIEGKCYASGTFEELENSNDPAVKEFFE